MNAALAEYSRLLVTRWRWIAWGVLISLAAMTVVLVAWPPLYRSDSTVFVRTPGDVSRVDDGGDSYARARAGTYAALIKSTSISARVIANLGLDMAPETLSKRIDASHADGTALIDIRVSAPSREEARRTAGVLLSEYAATVRSLESVPGSLVPRAEIVVVDPPDEPARILAWGAPIPLVVAGAILVGLILGALSAVIASILQSPNAPRQPARDGTAPIGGAAQESRRIAPTPHVPVAPVATPLVPKPAEPKPAEPKAAAVPPTVVEPVPSAPVPPVREEPENRAPRISRGRHERGLEQALTEANVPPR